MWSYLNRISWWSLSIYWHKINERTAHVYLCLSAGQTVSSKRQSIASSQDTSVPVQWFFFLGPLPPGGLGKPASSQKSVPGQWWSPPLSLPHPLSNFLWDQEALMGKPKEGEQIYGAACLDNPWSWAGKEAFLGSSIHPTGDMWTSQMISIPELSPLWGLSTGPVVADSGKSSPQSDLEGEERKVLPSVATSLQVLHSPLWCAFLFWHVTLLYLGSACHLQILSGCGLILLLAACFLTNNVNFKNARWVFSSAFGWVWITIYIEKPQTFT